MTPEVAAIIADAGLAPPGEPPPPWLPGLEVIVEAAAERGPLDQLRNVLVDHLARRAAVEHWLGRAPQIRSEPLTAPIFVTGLPRTGTTAVSMLLALDETIRTLSFWESRQPTPPPGADRADAADRRITARQDLTWARSVLPGAREFHPYLDDVDAPVETMDLLGMSFVSAHLSSMLGPSSYDDWLVGADHDRAYAFLADTLRLLQWRRERRTWVLKNPADLLALDAIARTFPDARFVWTHRPVRAALRSLAAMTVTAHPSDPQATVRWILDVWERIAEIGVAERAALGDDRFFDVSQPALRHSPVAVMRSLYEWLGRPLTDQHAAAIRAFAEDAASTASSRSVPGWDDALVMDRFTSSKALGQATLGEVQP